MFDISVLKETSENLWEIPKSFRSDMRVSALVYASEAMLKEISRDRSLEQLVNVATLPGIVGYALAMPDIHEGYGFPIGGVAAFDAQEGIISPGGIGYDINCGVRLLRSSLTLPDAAAHLEKLGSAIYREVPSGVGKGGRLTLKGKEFNRVLERGAPAVVAMGYGTKEDLAHTESEGCIADASSEPVSERAKSRGKDQLGTMGAGNHFVEVDVVEKIFDPAAAQALGIFEDQVTVLIHTGSRGLGHQIATDHIRIMMRAMSEYGITLPDRELACTPFSSKEGGEYFAAMAAGANFAWANRQLITWEVRKAFAEVFGEKAGVLDLVYDVAHNIAKIEEYKIDGVNRKLIVHRKGATRAFPDQPVIIPGSMGTASYVLVGQEASMHKSFGSTCHGAGRRMSRTQARRQVDVKELKQRLSEKGIVVNAGSLAGLAEESPESYKNVDEVVEIVHAAGIARTVARLRPIAVVKG